MAHSLKDIYAEIPFISEDNNSENRSLSKGGSSLVVPWLSDTKSYSDSPSPSSSFREDGALLTRKPTIPFVFISGQPYRTASLDDLRRKNFCRCSSRQGFRRKSQYSEYGGSFRQNRRKNSTGEKRYSRRSSTRSSRSRKNSCHLERSKSIKSESTGSRKLSSNLPPPEVKTEEDLMRAKRHRIAVWLVIAAFIFIALSSILVVVVTLTHQSYVHNNSTCTYYTFLRPSNITQVRFIFHLMIL